MGPPLGGFMKDKLGFRLTTDIMAILCFIFAIIYMVFNLVMFSDNKDNFTDYSND